MTESLIVIRTDESLEERRDDVLEEIERLAESEELGDVRMTIDSYEVDYRWLEGNECPECENSVFTYLNVEDREVSTHNGRISIRGMERHYAVLRVSCASCGHVVRSSPALEVAQFEGVTLDDIIHPCQTSLEDEEIP